MQVRPRLRLVFGLEQVADGAKAVRVSVPVLGQQNLARRRPIASGGRSSRQIKIHIDASGRGHSVPAFICPTHEEAARGLVAVELAAGLLVELDWLRQQHIQTGGIERER